MLPELFGTRCYMGAPLGDDHRCTGTTPSPTSWWCPACQAFVDGSAPRCTCAGCSLIYGPEPIPVAVWRVTRTDEPVPGNLVGWGNAPTLEAAARQGVDYAVDASFFGNHPITYSDLNDDERAVVDATFVNPITVEVRDFTVETMWDTTGAFAEVAS